MQATFVAPCVHLQTFSAAAPWVSCLQMLAMFVYIGFVILIETSLSNVLTQLKQAICPCSYGEAPTSEVC